MIKSSDQDKHRFIKKQTWVFDLGPIRVNIWGDNIWD